MPEKDFEIYLSLLSRLLRLSPTQKAAISDELRDHLEERLEGLIQSGISREDAIKTAMDEFGDVTGLAIDLTKVSRSPLRKIAVRSTVAVSMVTALIVGWITFFVPEHRIAAPPVVEAQQPRPAIPKDLGKPDDNLPSTFVRDEELFPDFLQKRTDVNFDGVPLAEVIKTIESMRGVPIMINKKAMADEGISLDEPVTMTLTGLTFEEVLNHLTKVRLMAWRVDGDLIRISTRTQNNECFLTRQYVMDDLLKRGHELGALMGMLRILPRSMWELTDGDGGKMAVVGQSLLVRQTYQSQRLVAEMLAMVDKPRTSVSLMGNCTGRDKLIALLQEPGSIDFENIPLRNALRSLSETYKVAILVNQRDLNDEGINAEQPVSLKLANRPFGKLLDELLGDLLLGYQVRDGVIEVTTQTCLDEDMTVMAYDVRELIRTRPQKGNLLKAVTQMTPGKWEATDGDGGALALTTVEGRLFVRQTDKVQTEIQVLIEQLKRSRSADEPITDADKESTASKDNLVLGTYLMSKETAANLADSLQRLVSPKSWTTSNGETPTIELISSTAQRENVEGVVSGANHEVQVISPNVKTAPAMAQPESATGQNVKSVMVRPMATLVIRQSPQVHAQIHKLLEDLNIPTQARFLNLTNGEKVMGLGLGDGQIRGQHFIGGGFF